MNFFQSILEILFPKHCVACKTKDDKGLCRLCLQSIPFCEKNKSNSIISVFPYRHHVVKKVIWECKFNSDFQPLSLLMNKVYDVLLDEMSDKNIFNNFQNPILVPIPLHKNRYAMRGFNQSEIIARELHKRNPSLFEIETTSLVRHKETKPQAKITHKRERLENIRECFKVTNPETFFNRNIILVDDITTTGATLEEAIKVLKKAGARNVYAFTVAK